MKKKGVLRDVTDEDSVILLIGQQEYTLLKHENIIADGMIPKLDNAFAAINQGVASVSIGHARFLKGIIKQETHAATRLTA